MGDRGSRVGSSPCNRKICGKSVADRRKHLRVHSGEAPYGCTICGRFFKQRAALNSHVKIHAGIKQFVCEICGKACSRKAHLKIHMRIHNGERPSGQPLGAWGAVCRDGTLLRGTSG
uniref:C2H2-type domain-containing protein n=1 Tax=Maylandia zebra TaxID=106582 RepID=A0A3P9DTH2_9CICH